MITSVLIVVLSGTAAQLHVEGNRLVESGKTVTLHGLTIPSFESTNQGEFVFRAARVALEDWGANCIRLPLSQDRWFGKAEKQKDKGAGYQELVDEVVTLVLNRSGYVVLDLNWSDAGVWGKNLGQHAMPDDHSVQFWKDVAVRYKAEPHVLFQLYGKPSSLSPAIWLDGGSITESAGTPNELTYHTPGIKSILETIRKARAKNICILPRPYEMNQVQDNGGSGLMVAVDLDKAESWTSQLDGSSQTTPMLIEVEPSSESAVNSGIFDAFASKQVSWIAGSFAPNGPSSLIKDWTYSPTPIWGAFIKSHLGTEASKK